MNIDVSEYWFFYEVKLTEEIQFNAASLKADGFVDFSACTPTDTKTSLANYALVLMFVPILFNWVQHVAL